MEVKIGDKVILAYCLNGTKTGPRYLRSHLVISRDDYEGARKLKKEDGIPLHEVFDIKEQEGVLVEGGPLYDAVIKSKLGTWISVSPFVMSDGMPYDNYYYIDSVVRKGSSWFHELMKKIDYRWMNYSDIDDDKIEEGVKALDEQILLTVASHLSKGENYKALELLHSVYNGWSFRRLINILKSIKNRRLTKAYAYFEEINNETIT